MPTEALQRPENHKYDLTVTQGPQSSTLLALDKHFVENNHSFNQGNMFISKSSKIIDSYFSDVFSWLKNYKLPQNYAHMVRNRFGILV